MRIVGTVDRVDTMELGGKTYIRVVDYKTGSKKFDLREVYYGLDCQMLLYLFTLERNGGHLFSQGTAAGVEYLWADPAPENIIRPETDDAEQAKESLYEKDLKKYGKVTADFLEEERKHKNKVH